LLALENTLAEDQDAPMKEAEFVIPEIPLRAVIGGYNPLI
jgi:hypothetical protein